MSENPKKYILPVRQKDKIIYDLIKNGAKRIETRGGGPKYDHIKRGDIVVVQCGDEEFTRKVQNVLKFSSVDKMLKKYKVEDINPKLHTPQELKALYKSFPGYEERIRKYGLIAFELK